MMKIAPLITSKKDYYYDCSAIRNVKSPIILFGQDDTEYSRDITYGQAPPVKGLNQVLCDEQAELDRITNHYNLINVPSQNNSEALNDAILLSNTFINKYGVLASSSREELLLKKHPNLSPSKKTLDASDYILENRKYSSNEIEMANNISELMLKTHFGNCGDCAYVLHKLGFEQFNNKYNILTINYYATAGCNGFSHVAMLLASKDGKEEYVIDPWLNPKDGGVYKREDWEVMMHEVFDVDANDKNNIIRIFTNDSIHKNMLNQK